MKCKKPWTREHQNAILKPSFVNKELKKHLEQVMFDRERAQFPETIMVIEDRRQIQKYTQEISLLRRKYEIICSEYRYIQEKIKQHELAILQKKTSPKLFPDKTAKELESDHAMTLAELSAKRDELRQRNDRVNLLLHWIQMPYDRRQNAIENYAEGVPAAAAATHQANVEKVRRKFVRACPIESCRGFLSVQWKCGICGIHTCSKCHIPKSGGDTHECNPDDVATAEMIENDTRPCPQCGTGIFKIDGCDQMWCIECHCAFSWRTGQIESGHVHNPHFFEYQRRMGNNARNLLDMPCNALEPAAYHGVVYALMSKVVHSKTNKKREQLGLPTIPRPTIVELRDKTAAVSYAIGAFYQIMNAYRNDAIQDNLELRVRYLTEEINDVQFRSNLSRDAKKFNKNREIGQVVQTVIYAMTDILNRLIDYLRENENIAEDYNVSSPERIMEILSETYQLLDYANECLAKICVEYKVTRVGMFISNSNINHETGLHSVFVKTHPDGSTYIEPKRAST
jgi:hypothetical protein